MERAVRILWTLAVVKGPATLTATVLCVLPSAALQGTVRTTRDMEGGRLLWTCVHGRIPVLPKGKNCNDLYSD